MCTRCAVLVAGSFATPRRRADSHGRAEAHAHCTRAHIMYHSQRSRDEFVPGARPVRRATQGRSYTCDGSHEQSATHEALMFTAHYSLRLHAETFVCVATFRERIAEACLGALEMSQTSCGRRHRHALFTTTHLRVRTARPSQRVRTPETSRRRRL